MNILYVATTVNLSRDIHQALGSTTHTYNIAKELSLLGHNVYVISKQTNDSIFETIDSFTVFRFDFSGKKMQKFFKYLKVIPEILKIIKRYEIDCILERNQSKGIGAIISILSGKPLILEAIDEHISLISIYRAKRIIAMTDVFFKDRNKITIVNAGVDRDLYKPEKAKQIYDLGFIGNFKEYDGLEDMVLALKGTRYKAILIGPGKRFEKIKQMIEENRLGKQILLIGKVDPKNISKLAAQVKILVAPFNIEHSEIGNFKKYGFYFSPIKIFEYMALGKPILASDYGLIRRTITEKSGLLFKPGDINDLRDKIKTLLNQDLSKIGKYNRELSKQYTWKKVAKTIEHEIINNCN